VRENGGAGPAGRSGGLDNDGDGLIDCGDPDCQGAPPCIAAAPVLGSSGFIIAALVLLTVGGVALALQRRASWVRYRTVRAASKRASP